MSNPLAVPRSAGVPAPPVRLVPMVLVTNCERSVAFWQKLGFEVGNTYANERDGKLNWAWLQADHGASFMVCRTDGPVDAGAQAALFYIYVPDVQAWHAELGARGVTVGPIETPEHSPSGEFRLEDPDGYVLYFAHARHLK